MCLLNLYIERLDFKNYPQLTWHSTIGFGMLDGIRPTLQLSNAWISIASIFDECGRVFPSCSWTSWTKENLSTFTEKSKTVFKYCEYLFANSFMFCYKFCCWSATSAMVQNISAAGVTTWDGWYEKSKFPIFKVNSRNQKFCDVESFVDSVRNQKFHNAILKLKVNMISGNSKLQFLK